MLRTDWFLMHTRQEQQGFLEEVEEEVKDVAAAVDAAAAAVLLPSPSSQRSVPSVHNVIEDPPRMMLHQSYIGSHKGIPTPLLLPPLGPAQYVL